MLNGNLPPGAQQRTNEDTLEIPAEDGPQTERVTLKAPPIKKSVL